MHTLRTFFRICCCLFYPNTSSNEKDRQPFKKISLHFSINADTVFCCDDFAFSQRKHVYPIFDGGRWRRWKKIFGHNAPPCEGSTVWIVQRRSHHLCPSSTSQKCVFSYTYDTDGITFDTRSTFLCNTRQMSMWKTGQGRHWNRLGPITGTFQNNIPLRCMQNGSRAAVVNVAPPGPSGVLRYIGWGWRRSYCRSLR